jgi:hypothetical protein
MCYIIRFTQNLQEIANIKPLYIKRQSRNRFQVGELSYPDNAKHYRHVWAISRGIELQNVFEKKRGVNVELQRGRIKPA